ncbi:DNA adenine methylase [Clostridium sp. DSM 100503]|uniref:DNA adenine methylase n=1 Tax=Clostridium sp. DSM 100503 TaxID=2963282 RepID=UPI00214A2A62|nr:DNA adenine methylase [Clostridium sp. DSM 100503]MCR1952740.1 DNA adenine methylase [Clostridium sp. DSM 100503]
MLNPPINRMGGKSRLRKRIINMMPEHTCYVEPFFGAGWTFFGKEKSEVEVINDVDKELINLFRMLKEHPEEVERVLKYEIIARDSFKEYKEMNIEHMTEIKRAVRYLYLINSSFAAKGGSFGYGALKKPNQKIFNQDFEKLRDRLKNTYVENKSAFEIIEKYDRPGTLFFCDPPYLGTTSYQDEFTLEDHIILRDILSNIQGKFILTINDHERIRELYKDFYIEEVQVMYSISREKEARKGYGELIIRNYENTEENRKKDNKLL